MASGNFWSCIFCLQIYICGFQGHYETHNRPTRTCGMNQLLKSTAPPNVVAEGTGRMELQRAAHFQGAKNVLIPLFVNVSNRQNQAARQESSWCSWCHYCGGGQKAIPWAAATEATNAAPWGSSSILSQVHKDPHFDPSHVIGPGSALQSNSRDCKWSQQGCKTNLMSTEGWRMLLTRLLTEMPRTIKANKIDVLCTPHVHQGDRLPIILL